MSRMKTKGEPIVFRLPLHAHELLINRCKALGVTPRAWVADIVAEALEPRARRVEANQSASRHPSVAQLRPPVCEHRKAVAINGGMRRCDDCGAIRGAGGKWSASNVRSI